MIYGAKHEEENQGHTTVTAYFSSKHLLLLTFVLQHCAYSPLGWEGLGGGGKCSFLYNLCTLRGLSHLHLSSVLLSSVHFMYMIISTKSITRVGPYIIIYIGSVFTVTLVGLLFNITFLRSAKPLQRQICSWCVHHIQNSFQIALKLIYHPLYSMNNCVKNKSKLPQDGAQVFPYMGWLTIMW